MKTKKKLLIVLGTALDGIGGGPEYRAHAMNCVLVVSGQPAGLDAINLSRGVRQLYRGGEIGIYVCPCGQVPDRHAILACGLEWIFCAFIGSRRID